MAAWGRIWRLTGCACCTWCALLVCVLHTLHGVMRPLFCQCLICAQHYPCRHSAVLRLRLRLLGASCSLQAAHLRLVCCTGGTAACCIALAIACLAKPAPLPVADLQAANVYQVHHKLGPGGSSLPEPVSAQGLACLPACGRPGRLLLLLLLVLVLLARHGRQPGREQLPGRLELLRCRAWLQGRRQQRRGQRDWRIYMRIMCQPQDSSNASEAGGW